MKELSVRIQKAHGKSTNLELYYEESRLGGNGPIMAKALVTFGTKVSLIGALGLPKIDPLFLPLAKQCKACISISPPGHTDALEFADGKLLLGKHKSILSIDEKTILKEPRFTKMVEEASLLAATNWTMLYGMTALWKQLGAKILPSLAKKPAWMFVDIADPAKRQDSDIKEALKVLSRLQKQLKVVLGLNVAEAERIGSVLHCRPSAQVICKKLKIEQVVIHAINDAESATCDQRAKVTGPKVSSIKITTGGGDNFNAGYTLGLLLGLSLQECLLLATHTSGYYVEYARSPTLTQLANYLVTKTR